MESLPSSPEIEKEPLTVDRIIAVFAYLPTNTIRYQKSSNLHGAFKQLAEEYPEQFHGAELGDTGGLVHSEQLDNAIDILQMSGFATEFMGARQGEIELFNQEELRELIGRFEGMDKFKPIADRFKELIEINRSY